MKITLACQLWASLKSFAAMAQDRNLVELWDQLPRLSSAANEAGAAFRISHKGRSLQLSTQCQTIRNTLIQLKYIVEDESADMDHCARIVATRLDAIIEICQPFIASLEAKFGPAVKRAAPAAQEKTALDKKPKLFFDMREAFEAAARELSIELPTSSAKASADEDTSAIHPSSNFTFDFESLAEACKDSLEAVAHRCVNEGERMVPLLCPLAVIFDGAVANLSKVPHTRVASSILLPNCLLVGFVMPKKNFLAFREDVVAYAQKKCPNVVDILDEGVYSGGYLKAKGFSAFGFLWFMPKELHAMLNPFTVRSVGFPL